MPTPEKPLLLWDHYSIPLLSGTIDILFTALFRREQWKKAEFFSSLNHLLFSTPSSCCIMLPCECNIPVYEEVLIVSRIGTVSMGIRAPIIRSARRRNGNGWSKEELALWRKAAILICCFLTGCHKSWRKIFVCWRLFIIFCCIPPRRSSNTGLIVRNYFKMCPEISIGKAYRVPGLCVSCDLYSQFVATGKIFMLNKIIGKTCE